MMRHLCVCGGGGQHRQRESGKSIGIAHVVWRNSRRLGVVPIEGAAGMNPETQARALEAAGPSAARTDGRRGLRAVRKQSG